MNWLKRGVSGVVCFVFVFISLFTDMQRAYSAELALPLPGTMLVSQGAGEDVRIAGLKLDPDNPFQLDFLIDNAGKGGHEIFQSELMTQVNYFLAALTTPKDKLWVNLSPYEQDRIIDESLESTDMGEALLSQDYILKQLSSSLTHPDTEVGRQYWSMENRNDLSKIWIMPDAASVVESEDGRVAVIDEAVLKVESEKFKAESLLMREVTSEVNTGKNFTKLRQIYNAIILAQWFKSKFADTFFKQFIDKGLVSGIETQDKNLKEKVFALYVDAFNKGAYDITKKERIDSHLQKRHYFSGGARLGVNPQTRVNNTDLTDEINTSCSNILQVKIESGTASAAIEVVRNELLSLIGRSSKRVDFAEKILSALALSKKAFINVILAESRIRNVIINEYSNRNKIKDRFSYAQMNECMDAYFTAHPGDLQLTQGDNSQEKDKELLARTLVFLKDQTIVNIFGSSERFYAQFMHEYGYLAGTKKIISVGQDAWDNIYSKPGRFKELLELHTSGVFAFALDSGFRYRSSSNRFLFTYEELKDMIARRAVDEEFEANREELASTIRELRNIPEDRADDQYAIIMNKILADLLPPLETGVDAITFFTGDLKEGHGFADDRALASFFLVDVLRSKGYRVEEERIFNIDTSGDLNETLSGSLSDIPAYVDQKTSTLYLNIQDFSIDTISRLIKELNTAYKKPETAESKSSSSVAGRINENEPTRGGIAMDDVSVKGGSLSALFTDVSVDAEFFANGVHAEFVSFTPITNAGTVPD